VPLQVAYARTIHTFQGLSAGDNHPYKCIICDPDNRNYESQNLGLLYTAVSRATTLGDSTGHNSAIYFTNNFKEERIRNLIQRKNSTDLLPSAIRRRNWVSELKRNTVSTAYTEEQLSDILTWAESYRSNKITLENKIEEYTQQLSTRPPSYDQI
jgi:hypothetical protein